MRLDEVIERLRELRQPVTLFGETLEDRVRRLHECEEKETDDHRKTKEDTLKSFIPTTESLL